MKHKKIFSICSILLSVFLVTMFVITYVTRPEYPENWSDIPPKDLVPNLTGFYMNAGEDQRNNKPSLYQVLIANDMVTEDAIDFIKITQTETELLIEAYQQGSLIKKRVAQLKPKNCKNGFVRLKEPKPERGINREGIVGYAWANYWLCKASDGTLVIRCDSAGVGLVLMFPMLGVQREWHRFSEYQTPEKEIPNKANEPTSENAGDPVNTQSEAALF